MPKSVSFRPPTAILKIASPLSNDHAVAMRLRLYEREWHFYETLASRVPIRVPTHLGSVKDAATGTITEGVMLEDLGVPGAELCPEMDEDGVLKTVSHIARQHAQFWNMPVRRVGWAGARDRGGGEVECGAMGSGWQHRAVGMGSGSGDEARETERGSLRGEEVVSLCTQPIT